MGDGPPDGPAMGRSVETRGCAALDRDPAVTVVGIAAETITMKSNSVTGRRIVRPLPHYSLSATQVNQDRPINFQQLPKTADGDFPSGNANGNQEVKAEVAILQ